MNYIETLKNYKSSEKYLEEYSYTKSLKIALGFPNTYKVGMGSLGFQIVYSIINNNSKSMAERFFLPDNETDTIRTIESQRTINSFDAIGLSVSFEMDYINILSILKNSNIPLLREERSENHPLIFVGGAITLINPFAISEFIDFFILGDGEDILDKVIDILSMDISKEKKLELLSENQHIYVPSFEKEHYKKHIIKDLSNYINHSVITTDKAEFGDTVLFEISRGCGRGCNFCAAGHIQKPFRLREPIIGETLPKYNSYGIVGAAVFDNPYSVELCKEIVNNGGKFSLSSIRLETINEEKINLMKEGKIQTVTIAPEAGSERLRDFIGKKCLNETIFNAVDISFKNGIRKFKLYFMIGLPSETSEDIDALIELVLSLAGKYPKAHFSPSCGSFVPKPHTKYEACLMDTEKNLKKKLDYIKKSLNKVRNINVSFESPRMAKIQAVLSRADSELGKNYLLCALENGYTNANREYEEEINDILYNIDKTEFVWSKLEVY